ncbi:MAG: uroporphyrinogen-III synthase [Chloroflexi bacterium]|nr:uroporphyrinogen-III synthase [Chloroflexota bacterium]
MTNQALAGICVLVTRPTDQASRLSEALRSEGAEVLEQPSIQIDPPLDWTPVDEAIHRDGYDWIVFASVNAVRFFIDRVVAAAAGIAPGTGTAVSGGAHQTDLTQTGALAWFRAVQVAAIGPETARTLEHFGVRPDLVPEEYVAEALAASMADSIPLQGHRVLLPQAEMGRDTLAAALKEAGALVDRVTVYRTVFPVPTPAIIDRLRRSEIDLVTFTSSSTVRNLVQMLGPEAGALKACVTACIGPVTAETAAELGLVPRVVATSYTIHGLVEAIRGYYVGRSTSARDGGAH